MATTNLPGEISTEPKEHIYFNGPFLKEQNMNIRVKNEGTSRIGWMIKSTHPDRFHIKPTTGELKVGEEAVLDVTCEPFDYNKEMSQDRVTVEWVEAPEKNPVFSREWFHQSKVVRRHVFPVEYNL